MIARHLGRAPSVNQYSRYEQEKADPPAYVLLAAARAVDIPVGRLLGDPQPVSESLLQRMDALESMAERVQHLEDQLQQMARRQP
jgi:transcriptional regulator with XRE-family HTH domain